jgi:beta-glucosidase
MLMSPTPASGGRMRWSSSTSTSDLGLSSRPVRELKGFTRITLGPGESRRVQFTLGPAELRYWSAAVRDWTIDASTFVLWVGGDSTAQLSTTFEVTKA